MTGTISIWIEENGLQ
ncbi:DUF1896 domain-containing protein [Empedobacter falsenii]|nr:DUF1896 domain-containing protein [Empedobacter falsenii]